MSDEWVETTLGAVTSFASGYSFPPAEQGHEDGAYPFYKVSDMNRSGNETWMSVAENWVDDEAVARMRAKVWPRGTVVFPKVGAALLTEKRRILSRPALFDNNVMGLIAGSELLPEFLFAQMQTVALGEFAQQGAVPSVNQGHVASIPITLPPLPVQRRIVDLMTHVDSHLANLRAERKAVEGDQRRMRDSVMKAGESRRAGDVFDILMGRQRSPSRATGPNMTRYLRAANVKDGWLELNDVKQMDFDAAERNKYGLQVGDVLVSEGSGSADAVGAAAQWNGEIDGDVCIQNTLLRYRAVPSVTVPSFVHHWCRWAYETGLFRDTATGTNILHIGSTRAVEMTVGWRVPEMQERQCAALDAYDRTIRALAAEAEALDQARTVLLSALLTGELEIDLAYDSLLDEVA